jgi:hypothetical protein
MLSLKAIAVLALPLPLLAVANTIVSFCSGPVYALLLTTMLSSPLGLALAVYTAAIYKARTGKPATAVTSSDRPATSRLSIAPVW